MFILCVCLVILTCLIVKLVCLFDCITHKVGSKANCYFSDAVSCNATY